MIKRTTIRDIAMSYMGVRWRHQGRHRHTGVDCVGLLIAINRDLGLGEVELPPYGRQPDGTLLSHFYKHMQRTPHAKVGTAVVFSFLGSPWHAGVITDNQGGMVHSFAREKKVVADMIHHSQQGRKIHCMFDWPGVLDG